MLSRFLREVEDGLFFKTGERSITGLRATTTKSNTRLRNKRLGRLSVLFVVVEEGGGSGKSCGAGGVRARVNNDEK